MCVSVLPGPNRPECAVFTWVSDDSVSFVWSRPQGQLSGYEIFYDDGFQQNFTITIPDPETLTYEITDLVDGTAIRVEIRATAGLGQFKELSDPVELIPSKYSICN